MKHLLLKFSYSEDMKSNPTQKASLSCRTTVGKTKLIHGEAAGRMKSPQPESIYIFSNRARANFCQPVDVKTRVKSGDKGLTELQMMT